MTFLSRGQVCLSDETGIRFLVDASINVTQLTVKNEKTS